MLPATERIGSEYNDVAPVAPDPGTAADSTPPGIRAIGFALEDKYRPIHRASINTRQKSAWRGERVKDIERNNAKQFSIRRIVFATDFLESSRLALDYAVAFAHSYRATLVIVHAFELAAEAEEAELLGGRPCVSRQLAQQRLEAFASGVRRSGILVEVDLREGEPCAAVLGSAVENHADLMVLGTHGVHRGLEHLVIGSNAEKILLSAQCPTLTVGKHVMAGIDLELSFNDVLFVSDFSEEAAAAAAYAWALARDLGIRVTTLQIVPEGDGHNPEDIKKQAEQFCNSLAIESSIAANHWCTPEYHLEKVISDEEVIRRAERSVDSLLVLGVRAKSRIDRHLHTSFAYELVVRAACPILSIHKHQEEPR
jgi:nucleotide-binding universal stress UspA family protein